MSIVASATDRKRHGKHYTPAALADFLAERTLAQLRDVETIRVLDPACGDGELLLAAHRAAARMGVDERLELVGYDLDPAALVVARARATGAGVAVRFEQGDFLRVARTLPEGSVDVVITNPPYVRTQQLGQELAQELASEFGLQGRVDLTHPFVAIMPRVLRSGGVLGLLCSNRFMTTKAGVNVRKIFQSDLAPVEVFDLGDTRLFEAAVLPAIVIALNTPSSAPPSCRFSSSYEVASESPVSNLTLFEALVAEVNSAVTLENRKIEVRVGRLECPDSPLEPWRISSAHGDDWLASVDAATWRTFGDLAKIRVGIKTTADAVFISNDWSAASPRPEESLLRPLITHDNIAAWTIEARLTTHVLYPYDLTKSKRTLVDMALHPLAMAYLESHAERLKGRKYVLESGREWYEIWVPQRPGDWVTPKIVFPDISVSAKFAIDLSGSVVNGDCYWISVADIGSEDLAYLMVAVANSSLGQRFYDEVCGNKLYSGRRRWMTQYVAKLPLPTPDTPIARAIIAISRELVAADEPIPSLVSELDDLVHEAFAAGCGEERQMDTLF